MCFCPAGWSGARGPCPESGVWLATATDSTAGSALSASAAPGITERGTVRRCTVMRPSVSTPSGALAASALFLRMVAAPIRSISDTATCPTTSTLRSVEPRTPGRTSPRSACVSESFVDCSAGSNANITVASAATRNVKAKTRWSRSSGTDARHRCGGRRQRTEEDGDAGAQHERRQAERGKPRRWRRAGCPRSASAGRPGRGWRRATGAPRCRDSAPWPRASMRFETLAQAATSTRPNAAKTGDRTRRSSSVSGAGVACRSTCARVGLTCSMTRVIERAERDLRPARQ